MVRSRTGHKCPWYPAVQQHFHAAPCDLTPQASLRVLLSGPAAEQAQGCGLWIQQSALILHGDSTFLHRLTLSRASPLISPTQTVLISPFIPPSSKHCTGCFPDQFPMRLPSPQFLGFPISYLSNSGHFPRNQVIILMPPNLTANSLPPDSKANEGRPL